MNIEVEQLIVSFNPIHFDVKCWDDKVETKLKKVRGFWSPT